MRAGFVLALLLISSGSAHASGWRPAEANDVMNLGDWQFRKERADLALSASGDFDGDGTQDGAELRINESAGKFGLFVHLANGQAVLLAEHLLNDLPAMGIAMRPRGSYLTFLWQEERDPARSRQG